MKNNKKKLSVSNASDAQIKASLRAWIKGASNENKQIGLEWYKDAQAFCNSLANEFDLPAYICASVVSMLSPNNKWERNKIDARAVINLLKALSL